MVVNEYGEQWGNTGFVLILELRESCGDKGWVLVNWRQPWELNCDDGLVTVNP
jgi:hypothetical protein